jgi:hypothetical protein
MPAKKPSQTPAEKAEVKAAAAQPSESPAAYSMVAGSGMGESRPKDLSPQDLVTAAAGAAGEAKPSAVPPAEAGGVAAWQNNKRVAGLWSINQNRNAWVFITGVGWKKLANNSDSAIVALTVLSASARQTQTQVNYRDEADGMIHEMYVW